MTTCQECFRAKCEISLASGKLISLENRLKQQSPKIHLIDHLQERYRSEKCFERQRKIITDSLLDKHQISPKMAEILKGRVNTGMWVNHTYNWFYFSEHQQSSSD